MHHLHSRPSRGVAFGCDGLAYLPSRSRMTS